MTDFLLEQYLWLKSFHIIAVMAWMAGMLYLPRLFVYHVSADIGSDMSETFKVMERRLLKFIMNPAMMITWVLGVLMLVGNTSLMEQPWMHIKLLAIIFMTAIHMLYARWYKVFLRDENQKTPKFYKIWNEVPTILMILIVIMAVAEPF